MNKLQEAHNVICRVAEKQSSCIVMCSLGKDSLVTLDLVYPHFLTGSYVCLCTL